MKFYPKTWIMEIMVLSELNINGLIVIQEKKSLPLLDICASFIYF